MQPSTESRADQSSVDGRSKRRVDNGQRLLDAAIELLEHKPYQEVSVEDICDAAGVGRATFFRAFKSKSGLIVEYNRRLANKVKQQLDILDPPDAIQSLRVAVAVFADYYASTSPGLGNMVIDSIRNWGRNSTGDEIPSELVDVLTGIVKAGVAEGSIQSKLPNRLTTYVLLSHLGAAANYWFFHRDRDIQQMTKDALEDWLYGSLAGNNRN